MLFRVNKICEMTGLLEANIYFVEKYCDKVDVCECLGVLNHIDDRGEVLVNMIDRVPNLIWFAPSETDKARWSEKLSGQVVKVNNWIDLIPLLGYVIPVT